MARIRRSQEVSYLIFQLNLFALATKNLLTRIGEGEIANTSDIDILLDQMVRIRSCAMRLYLQQIVMVARLGEVLCSTIRKYPRENQVGRLRFLLNDFYATLVRILENVSTEPSEELFTIQIRLKSLLGSTEIRRGELQEHPEGSETRVVDVVRVRCTKGHAWTASAERIVNGAWCGHCRKGKRKYTIEKMRALAALRGGRCLSDIYVNTDTKLLWQCSEGHVWRATPIHILTNRWCRICGQNRQKRTLSDMQALATARGGKCLSSVYHNRATPLQWECANKHRWKAPPGRVIGGSWCNACARKEQGARRRKGAFRSQAT
jgi:hypothetical protein